MFIRYVFIRFLSGVAIERLLKLFLIGYKGLFCQLLPI